MTKEQDEGDAPLAVPAALAEAYGSEALQLRLEFQRDHAAALLERLLEIAMDPGRAALQVSAIRELLDQILGRPMPAAAIPAKLGEDTLAALEAMGARLREKLDRLEDGNRSGRAEETDR